MREITGAGDRGTAPRSARRRRLAAAALGLGLAGGGLVGCGDGGNGGDGGDAKAAKADESGAAEAVGYVSAPDGVTLTDPGTELALGESAVVGWEPREGTVAVLDVDVRRIERTSFAASFQGWQIDAATAASTPYFVRAEVTNVSGTELGGTHVLLWAQDDAGTLVDAQRFTEKRFAPCPSGDLPKSFADGDSTDVCFVYLISPGRSLEAVAFPPPEGLDEVRWSGRISTKVQVPKRDRKKSDKASGTRSDDKSPGEKKTDDTTE